MGPQGMKVDQAKPKGRWAVMEADIRGLRRSEPSLSHFWGRHDLAGKDEAPMAAGSSGVLCRLSNWLERQMYTANLGRQRLD